MIRHYIRILTDRLATDVQGLRAELADMRERFETSQRAVIYSDGRNDELYAEIHALKAEVARLRPLAGNTEATDSEQAVLDVVARMPGALAKDIGRAVWQVRADAARAEWDAENHGNPGKEPPAFHWYVGECNDFHAQEAARPLSSLHRKALVRRERAGQSYRYWRAGE